MKKLLGIWFVLLICVPFFAFLSCKSSKPATDNPPAPGFNAAGSDARAIAIAWGGYQKVGNILIATERGARGSLAPVEALRD